MYLSEWSNDMGDGYEMYGARHILQNNIVQLDDEQLEKLNDLDDAAIELLDNYHGEETRDAWSLRQCVELAHQKAELFA